MTREQAIERLTAVQLDETVGMGGYRGSAAYKLANRDVDLDAAVNGLDDADEIRAALAGQPVEWEETAY